MWGIVIDDKDRTATQINDLRNDVLLVPKVLPGKGGGIPIINDSLDNFARNYKRPFTVFPFQMGMYIKI